MIEYQPAGGPDGQYAVIRRTIERLNDDVPVYWIIRALQEHNGDLDQVAQLYPPEFIRESSDWYSSHKDEIDAWIQYGRDAAKHNLRLWRDFVKNHPGTEGLLEIATKGLAPEL